MVPSKAAVVSTGLFNFKGSGLLCDLSVLKKLGDFSVDFKFYLLSGWNGNFQAFHMPCQNQKSAF